MGPKCSGSFPFKKVMHRKAGVMCLQAEDSPWKQLPEAGRGMGQIFPLGLENEPTCRHLDFRILAS